MNTETTAIYWWNKMLSNSQKKKVAKDYFNYDIPILQISDSNIISIYKKYIIII